MVSTFPGIQTLEKKSHKESGSEGKLCTNAQAQPLFLNFSSPRFRTHNSFPAPLHSITHTVAICHLCRVHMGTSVPRYICSPIASNARLGYTTTSTASQAANLLPLRLCLFLPSLEKGMLHPNPHVGFFSSLTLTQPRVPWSFSLNSACDSFNHTDFQKAEF